MKLLICRKQVCSQSRIVLSDRSANAMNKFSKSLLHVSIIRLLSYLDMSPTAQALY